MPRWNSPKETCHGLRLWFQPRAWAITCAVLIVAAGVGVFGCSRPSAEPSTVAKSPPKLPRVRLQLDWFPEPEHGGVYQAVAKHFYQDEGIETDLLPGGAGRPILTGLLTGQADLEIAQSTDVMMRINTGVPLVIIGAVMQHDPLAVMVHDESPVHSFGDLNGRTVMALPGTVWMSYVKKRYHIDFKIIPMNFSLAQFMADKDFIQQGFITSEPYYVQQKGVKARTLLIADSGFDPYRVFVTTRKFAREHPSELKRFMAASVRGWNDFIDSDPTPAENEIQRLNPQMTGEFMSYCIAAIRANRLITGRPEKGERTGLITPGRLEAQLSLLSSMGFVSPNLKVADVARFDMIPPETDTPHGPSRP